MVAVTVEAHGWGKTSENDDGVALEAMLGAEDRGDYAVLESFMLRLGARLTESADDEIRTAYHAMAERAAKGFEHEAKHGRGSLMKWDHPVNAEWVRIGLIKLGDNERRAFETA